MGVFCTLARGRYSLVAFQPLARRSRLTGPPDAGLAVALASGSESDDDGEARLLLKARP